MLTPFPLTGRIGPALSWLGVSTVALPDPLLAGLTRERRVRSHNHVDIPFQRKERQNHESIDSV